MSVFAREGEFSENLFLQRIYIFLIQAEECEKTQSDTVETEKRVLEEFGVCLAQIIEASSRSRKPPLSQ